MLCRILCWIFSPNAAPVAIADADHHRTERALLCKNRTKFQNVFIRPKLTESHLFIKQSAAWRTGYMYRPVGTSLTVADFSLYCGRWASRAIVVIQPKIQDNSVCCGTVDCTYKFAFAGSMPHASSVAVIWKMFSRNSAAFCGQENRIRCGSLGCSLANKYSHKASSSSANLLWNTLRLHLYFVCQPKAGWRRNSFRCEGCQSAERQTQFFEATFSHPTEVEHVNIDCFPPKIIDTNLLAWCVTTSRHMIRDISTKSNISRHLKHVHNHDHSTQSAQFFEHIYFLGAGSRKKAEKTTNSWVYFVTGDWVICCGYDCAIWQIPAKFSWVALNDTDTQSNSSERVIRHDMFNI